MNKRIIEFLTLDFPPIGGGISRYLYEIINHMPPDSVRVTGVSAPDYEVFDQKQNFPINRLRIPTRWDAFQKQLKFFAPCYLRALLAKRNSSMIVCGQAHYSLLLPAWLVSKLRNIPYGVFTFGMDLLYPQTTVYKGLFNYLLKKADIVFADSSAAAQILPGLGVNPAQVVVVYPSVNITGRVPDADLLEALRERHGLAGKKCILTVGRLVERKGHDTVLRAMPQILESVPEAHYLIVGQGVHEPTLRALVQELQLTSHVTFAGYAAEEELSTYYALGDVFVMISREIPEKGDIEGFGMVYLEANLLGKPVVAGRSGGVPEAVLHEQTGLLVMPTDVQEVSEAITRLLNAPELAERLGNFGRRRTIMDFSSRANADRVFKILRTIAAE